MGPAEGDCPVDHKLLAEQQKIRSSGSQEHGQSKSRSQEQSEAKGNCPVDHDAMTDSKAGAKTCPVDHSQLRPAQNKAQKCPVDHSAMSVVPGGLQNGKPPKAVCPFGFGSSESGGPTMTSLHCPKCKALFLDCVQTNCEHNFCRDCILVGKECLACGDEVTAVKPERKVQDLVDTFVATHSSDPKFVEDKAAAGNTQDPEQVKAEFLLEIALQSFAGGNYKAALARLQLCKDQLLGMTNSQQPSADIAMQLGAVCGSQGDCQARLGDADQATSSYSASIAYLEDCPTKSAEVEKALTVTQNKLGDLQYRMGNLQTALSLYHKALEMRQRLADSASEGERPLANLDLAFSLAKTADLEQVLGQSAAAIELLQKAANHAHDLRQQSEKLDASGRKRLEALDAFLTK